MARITIDDIKLQPATAGDVKMTIAGKTHVIPAADLLRIANTLGNVAFDQLPDNGALPTINDIMLKPLDGKGMAALRLITDDGHYQFSCNAILLLGMRQAAEAALEFSEGAGSA